LAPILFRYVFEDVTINSSWSPNCDLTEVAAGIRPVTNPAFFAAICRKLRIPASRRL